MDKMYSKFKILIDTRVALMLFLSAILFIPMIIVTTALFYQSVRYNGMVNIYVYIVADLLLMIVPILLIKRIVTIIYLLNNGIEVEVDISFLKGLFRLSCGKQGKRGKIDRWIPKSYTRRFWG
jgi:hypothetical protein